MPQQIDELSAYDKVRVHRNVTDLLWFYAKPSEAADMARQFLFSVASKLARPLVTGQSYDSLEILWHLLNSFDRTAHAGTGRNGEPPPDADPVQNRFVVIGGYGWGKSSLALVAANLLGLPADSPGHAAVVTALEPESNAAPRQLVDKRNKRKEKFVVCIKGSNADFHELLIGAVAKSKALYADVLSKAGIDLTFQSEYEAAASWLREAIAGGNLDKALRETKEKPAELIGQLEQLQRSALERADALWRVHLGGGSVRARPHWYSQTDTAQYLEELVEAVTKPANSPFDGVLVLFDELGLWLGFANEDQARANVPGLLAFMEAAPRLAGKLTVCSFIQSDIEAFVGRESANNNVRHISGRLGARVHYKPDLELVFQSAIRDRAKGSRLELWKRHEQEFTALADLTARTFPRYRDGTWASPPGRVKDVLVKRCWPIHPFMVAAVCHLRFGEGSRVISILESQFESLGRQMAEDAQGHIRWSVPADVVDFYKGNFENLHASDGERGLWSRYQAAKEALRGRETPLATAVLKGVFLAHALGGSIRADRPEEFPAIVAAFAGVDQSDALVSLRDLAVGRDGHNAVLLPNPGNGWYEFYGAAESPLEARSAVSKAYDKSDGFAFFGDPRITEVVRRQLPVSPSIFAAQRNVAVHSYSQCFEAVVDLAKLSDAHIVAVAKSEIRAKLDPDFRGVHFIVLYSKDKLPKGLPEGGTLTERVLAYCQSILDGAWKTLKASGEQVPLTLSVPKEPPDELYRSLGLYVAAGQLPHADRARLGEGLVSFQTSQWEDVGRHLRNLRPNRVELLMPSPAAGGAELSSVKRSAASKDLAMSSFFEAVYSQRPPLNSDALGKGGTKYVRYVYSLMLFLMNPARAKILATEDANILGSVLTAMPGLEGRSWFAVQHDSEKYDVVVPKEERAAACYQELCKLLDETVIRGPKSTKALYSTLAKAPWGLDVRSFSLLLGIWVASNREKCQLKIRSSAGEEPRAVTWEDFGKLFEKSKSFNQLFETDAVQVGVRDTAAELARLRDLLMRLEGWTGNEKDGAELLSNVEAARSVLPTAQEWQGIDRECRRVSERLAGAELAATRIRDVRQDIEAHFSLGNAKDSLRRLASAIAGWSDSQGVVESATKSLELLAKKIESAAQFAIGTRYSSPEVECHELEQAKSRIQEFGFELEATEGWNSKGRAYVSEPLARLDAALADARKRHVEEAKKAETLLAFGKEVEEQATLPDSPTIEDLANAIRSIKGLSSRCPAELRKSFDERLNGLLREHQYLESAANSALVALRRRPIASDVALDAIEKIAEALPRYRGAKEFESLREIADGRQAVVAAAAVRDACRDSRDLSTLEDASRSLKGISSEQNGMGLGIIKSWREEVDARASSIRTGLEQAHREQAVRAEVAEKLGRLGAPPKLSELRVLQGDLAGILATCPPNLAKELEGTKRSLEGQAGALERDARRCLEDFRSGRPDRVPEALRTASSLLPLLDGTEEASSLRHYVEEAERLNRASELAQSVQAGRETEKLRSLAEQLAAIAGEVGGEPGQTVKAWAATATSKVAQQAREEEESRLACVFRALIAETTPGDSPTFQELQGGLQRIKDEEGACPARLRKELDTHRERIARARANLEREVAECIAAFCSKSPKPSVLAAKMADAGRLAKRVAGTADGTLLQELVEQEAAILRAGEEYSALNSSSSLGKLVTTSLSIQSVAGSARGLASTVLTEWANAVSALLVQRKNGAEAEAKRLLQALASAQDSAELLELHSRIGGFVDSHQEAVPEACSQLREALGSAIKQRAPVQIAGILRAVPPSERDAVLEAARELALRQ